MGWTRLLRVWMVIGCLAALPPVLDGQAIGGISALLPFGAPSVDPSLLSNPNVDGISARLYWRDFYSRPDDPASPIDWTGLDVLFAQAAKAGKLVRLAVAPGFYSPSWVLKSVPVLMLPVPQGPLSGSALQPMPVPWDKTYLNAWLGFVDQLAARYGGQPNLSWISVAGPNSHNDEVNLPHDDPVSQQTWLTAASNAGISGQTQQLDWLQQQLEQAWFLSIDRFDAAFGKRSRHYTIALINHSFPVEGDDAREQTYRNDLVVYGATHYPRSFGVQTNGLNGEPLCTNVAAPHPWWDYIRTYSSTLLTGFQTQAPDNLYCAGPSHSAVLRQAIDNALQYQAHFIEIYSSDIRDPTLVTDLTYAHQKLSIALSSTTPFTFPNRGGASMTSSGAGSSTALGYGEIQPNGGSSTPAGVAIFGLRQNNVLVSEVGVPATPALSSGRIYAEIAGAVDAGLAIANPNSSAATISFYFTDANGNPAGSGSTMIAANHQIAQFLDQPPFNVYTTATFHGSFTFTSSVPVAVVALRGFTNERNDFLMSTLPVVDPTAAALNGTAVVADFADGGGWTTQVLLVNPTDNPMTGTVQFANPAGAAANVTIEGRTNSSFVYSIPKRTSAKLATSGLTPTTASGSIRIVPTGGGAGPTPLVVFSYKPAEVTISEAGAPVISGSAFRVYVEASSVPGRPGNIESGIAVASTSTASASVTFDVTDLTGATVGGIPPVAMPLAAAGQTVKFLSDIFPLLPSPFKGVLRITTTSSGLSVVGLRTRMNERGDFLITTTLPTNESSASTTASMYFPQVADGGGYTSQFILFSGIAGQTASGVLQLVKQDGSSFGLPLN